jgi:hypothetical protein
MHLVPDTGIGQYWQDRANEATRICRALDDMLTPAEKLQAAPIINWLSLRQVKGKDYSHYLANEGEPLAALEERVRIGHEMEELFPAQRVGACANIWLWLKLGAPDGSLGGEAGPISGSGYQSEQ